MDNECNEVAVIHEAPQPEEYCQLRIRAGLSPKSLDGARTGLHNSIFAVSLRQEGKQYGFDYTAPRSLGMYRRIPLE